MAGLQFIPVMDARQYAWELAVNVANAIRHSPLAYQRVVYGMIKPLSNPAGYVSVPVGTIGYDAADRLVLMSATGGGGTGSVKMRCPCAVSALVKMMCLIPWDLRGELGAYENPPSAAVMQAWVISLLRDAMNGMGVSLPEVPNLIFAPPKGAAQANIGDMLADTVPVLDFFQSAWQTAIDAANTLEHHPPVYEQDIMADAGGGLEKAGVISYNAAAREVRISIDENSGSGVITMKTNAAVWFALQLTLLCPFNLLSPSLPTMTQIKGYVMNIVNDVFDALGWARPFPLAPEPPALAPALPVPKMPELPKISVLGTTLFPRGAA
jgi:hypothetical protein